MKLISRIALRLSLALLPLMALWGVLFYFTMVDEINDEADDALEDYSELIVKRMLAGRELPKPNNGSNNSYSIVPIGAPEAAVRPHIDYYDAEVYIPEKEETEPARVLTTIFQDADGAYYELKVATPTFEKDDLLRAILYWVVFLYLLLLLTTISLTVWVFHRSMRPLYELLRWLDDYTPGRRGAPVPCSTRIVDFRTAQCCGAAGRRPFRSAVRTAETLYRQCVARVADSAGRAGQPDRVAARQHRTHRKANGRAAQNAAHAASDRAAQQDPAAAHQDRQRPVPRELGGRSGRGRRRTGRPL